MAKCIVEQDTERYFDLIAQTSVLAKESTLYFHQITDDINIKLNSVPDSDTKHLILTGISKKDAHINLDEWKAKRISFVMCDFENMTFKSNQKHVDFLGCTFKKVYHMCCISINNGTIKDCVFDDCKADAKCLFQVDQTTMTGCRFTYCIRKGGASSDAGIVQATNNSVLQNCIFECCSADDRDPLSIKMSTLFFQPNRKAPTSSILLLRNSKQKNNSFQNCTGEKTQQM